MAAAAPSTASNAVEFDQRPHRAATSADLRSLAKIGAGFGAVLLTLGVVARVTVPQWISRYPAAGVEVATVLVIFGAVLVAAPPLAWISSDPLVSLEIDDRQVVARYRRRKERTVEWADAGLRGSLIHAVDRMPSGERPPPVGWILSLRGGRSRISASVSQETGDALVERVRTLGIPYTRGTAAGAQRSTRPTRLILIRFGRSGDVGLPGAFEGESDEPPLGGN